MHFIPIIITSAPPQTSGIGLQKLGTPGLINSLLTFCSLPPRLNFRADPALYNLKADYMQLTHHMLS